MATNQDAALSIDDGGQEPLLDLSGWWRRVAANLVDYVVILVPLIVIALLTHGIHWTHDHKSGRLVQHRSAVFIVISVVVEIAYQAGTLCRPGRHNGQTLGDQWLGIAVVRDDGRPFGIDTYLVRQLLCQSLLGYVLPLVGGFGVLLLLVVALDDLWPLWDPENRAVHDMISRTHVLRIGPDHSPRPVAAALS